MADRSVDTAGRLAGDSGVDTAAVGVTVVVGVTVTDEAGADGAGAVLEIGGGVTVRGGLTAACLAVPVTAVCARVTASRT
jgi:hypothetical protein